MIKMPKAKYVGIALVLFCLIGTLITISPIGEDITNWVIKFLKLEFSEEQYAYLTQDSLDCIECHGRYKEAEGMEIEPAWGGGEELWGGYKIKSTYIAPHVKIEKISFFINNVYAQQYEGAGNHPVGVPMPFDPQEYNNPPKCVDIVLPHGFVECESCHIMDMNSESETHGIVLCEQNKKSKLCLGCHNK